MHGFEQYLKDVHQTSMEDVQDNVFYIIPLNGCEFCAVENMRSILTLTDQKIIPILVGIENSIQVEKFKAQILEQRKIVLTDESSLVSKYETGFFKPIVVHIRQGKLVYYQYITDDLISDVHNYLIEE
jgi:hypothetical protein